VAAGVVDTGGKLAADSQRHWWSTFAAGIVYIGANFPIFSSSLCILIISDFPCKSKKQYTH
jgi:hypothetical protein